jgi:hypothetical protein
LRKSAGIATKIGKPAALVERACYGKGELSGSFTVDQQESNLRTATIVHLDLDWSGAKARAPAADLALSSAIIRSCPVAVLAIVCVTGDAKPSPVISNIVVQIAAHHDKLSHGQLSCAGGREMFVTYT